MNYKTRKGIVSIKVCGTRLLIPASEAAPYCPKVYKLSFLSGAIWDMLENEKSMNEIYSIFQKLLKANDSEVRIKVDSIINNFKELGYILID